jgi:hypothetical protein
VLRGEPVITTADDAVANMRVIDDVYRAAGLAVRGTTVRGTTVRGTKPGTVSGAVPERMPGSLSEDPGI